MLLVDDSKDITSTLKRGLENHGYRVDAFNDPREALANCKQANYDVAILDVRMPQMNGFDLARRLWQHNEKLQVCFLTAFEINASEARKTMPGLKNHCFIIKPLKPSELARHIQKHLKPSPNNSSMQKGRPSTVLIDFGKLRSICKYEKDGRCEAMPNLQRCDSSKCPYLDNVHLDKAIT